MTPNELVENTQFKVAMANFAQYNPWRGNLGERSEKFIGLHNNIVAITGRNITLNLDSIQPLRMWKKISSGASNYNPISATISLSNKFSVITFLHEWGHALGLNEVDASAWSNRIFEIYFPDQFHKLRNRGTAKDTMMVIDRSNLSDIESGT